ncbi:t-SNARE affecting a late Golgi compartment protein 1 [Diutina catenulata]
MDPFNEVEEDAWATLKAIDGLIDQRRTTSIDPRALASEFKNNWQELEEIYTDLEQALEISAQTPDRFSLTAEDVDKRRQILRELSSRMADTKKRWEQAHARPRDVTTMSNRISHDDENPFSDANQPGQSWQQQQMIDEQDTQLDSIHQTMRNLNQQAQLMGSELEDQGFMLDDLERDLDNVDSKLQRGMKRINHFIEKNRESASSWCIAILIVVLVVLLVMVLVA